MGHLHITGGIVGAHLLCGHEAMQTSDGDQRAGDGRLGSAEVVLGADIVRDELRLDAGEVGVVLGEPAAVGG